VVAEFAVIICIGSHSTGSLLNYTQIPEMIASFQTEKVSGLVDRAQGDHIRLNLTETVFFVDVEYWFSILDGNPTSKFSIKVEKIIAILVEEALGSRSDDGYRLSGCHGRSQ
jgi:hypothetical protein